MLGICDFMNNHVSFTMPFKKSLYPGTYIVIEGIDGSGKTTQRDRLQAYFTKQGKEMVVTGEPHDTLPVGKFIRQILINKIRVHPNALQYLYSADRVVNHETIVLPALQAGKIVLSHRSFWSIIPYGVLDRKRVSYDHDSVDPLFVSQGIFSYYYQFTKADYTFYLDVSLQTAMDRLTKMGKAKDIYEKKEKLARVLEGYQWLTKTFPQDIIAIDGEKSIESITEAIIRNIHSED